MFYMVCEDNWSLPGRSLLPIFLCYAIYGLAQMDYSASNSAGLGAGWLRC